MNSRCTILPLARPAEFDAALAQHLAQAAAAVQPENFASLLDPLMREVIRQGFVEATADEGTVWLLDAGRENLVPACNTGPHAERMVGQFKQPLGSGLVCMVFSSEQPFMENEVQRNSRQSKLLDELLAVQTQAMIAIPFYFLKACRGVISCVKLGGGSSIPGPASAFSPEHLASVQRMGEVLSRLLEHRLLSHSVGWISEPL